MGGTFYNSLDDEISFAKHFLEKAQEEEAYAAEAAAEYSASAAEEPYDENRQVETALRVDHAASMKDMVERNRKTLADLLAVKYPHQVQLVLPTHEVGSDR